MDFQTGWHSLNHRRCPNASIVATQLRGTASFVVKRNRRSTPAALKAECQDSYLGRQHDSWRRGSELPLPVNISGPQMHVASDSAGILRLAQLAHRLDSITLPERQFHGVQLCHGRCHLLADGRAARQLDTQLTAQDMVFIDHSANDRDFNQPGKQTYPIRLRGRRWW